MGIRLHLGRVCHAQRSLQGARGASWLVHKLNHVPIAEGLYRLSVIDELDTDQAGER